MGSKLIIDLKRWYPLLLVIAVTFTYWQLPYTNFQQDEWHSFADTIYQQSFGLSHVAREFFQFQGLTHAIPLARLFNFLLFNLAFPSVSLYALTSITFHIINSLLLFYLLKNYLILPPWASFLGSLFFGLNAVSSQATIWLGTFTGTETSLTFLLFSLILFFRFIEQSQFRDFIVSMFSLIIALLFKETVIFMFLLLPVIGYWLLKQKSKVDHKLILFTPLLLGGLLLLPRFSGASSLVISSGAGGNGLELIVFNLLTIPLKALAQIWVPEVITKTISLWLTNKGSWFAWESFGESFGLSFYDYLNWMMEGLSLLLGFFLVLALVFWLIRKYRSHKLKSEFPLVFGALLLILASLPFVILGRSQAYLASRYYYIPVVGGAIMLSWLCSSIFSNERVKKIKKGILISLLSVYFCLNVNLIQQEIIQQVKKGDLEQQITQQILKGTPQLPMRAVFYFSGNKSDFFDTPSHTLPTQSGFGNTLMVWYWFKGQLSADFFKSEFLWEIGENGYREIGERGFGYFSNEEKLVEAMRKYDLSDKNIIRYFYDAENEEIIKVQNSKGKT